MAEPKVKEAKRQVKFEDIKFDSENKVKAIIACIPIIGLILLFVEKDDDFVRYYGAQYTIIGALLVIFYILSFILVLIPLIGWIFVFFILPLFWLAVVVLIIMGMVNANNGKKFEIPMISQYALKLMSAI